MAGQLKFDFEFELNMGRKKNTYEVEVSISLITRNDRKNDNTVFGKARCKLEK